MDCTPTHVSLRFLRELVCTSEEVDGRPDSGAKHGSGCSNTGDRSALTHEAKVIGTGRLKELKVSVAIPVFLPPEQILHVAFSPEPARKVTARCGTLADIPADVKKTYTANGSKYLIDDPYIEELARHTVGNEKNPYWIARRIFDAVRTRLAIENFGESEPLGEAY